MKTTYVDPLIPQHETSDETLTRLSANIGTLTALMDDAQRSGHIYLAGIFSRARATKVAEAQAMIATPTADDKATPEPVGSPLGERRLPAWKDVEPALNGAAELLQPGADGLVIERRFLLVGTAVSVGDAMALSAAGETRRQQHRRTDTPRRFLPLLTDPRLFQIALA